MPTLRSVPAWLQAAIDNAEAEGRITRHDAPTAKPEALPICVGSEAAFQAEVIKYAKERGWLVYHTHDSRRSEPGFPDLVMVRGSVLIFAELKYGTGKPTPEQKAWLKALKLVPGLLVFTWWPADWLEITRVLR